MEKEGVKEGWEKEGVKERNERMRRAENVE